MTRSAIAWVRNDGGRSDAGYVGKTGDCVVRAISIAAELPYQKVYDDLHAEMKKIGRGSPRNGVPKSVYRTYLADIGWAWTPTMSFGSGCRVHLRADELPRGRLVVRLSKHLVAVIDGVIHDRYDCSRDGTRCVYGYWRKR